MDTLVELLHSASQEYGEDTALAITPGVRQQRWSYQKLWDYSGRLAALLQERGAQKGDRAVIWSPNRPEWVLAYFGCLRAGVIPVPLDVRSSPDFVSRIIGQTGPKLAFCARQIPPSPPFTKGGLGGFAKSELPTIDLEELEALLEGHPDQWTEPAIAADDIAVLMFTSGTTGDPKGVILTHRNLMANIMACREMVPVDSSSRLLSLLPLSHMLEQTAGLLVPLSRGASIIYPTSRQPRTLFKTMQRDGVTNFIVVPQALELMMSGIEREVRSKGKEKQWQFSMLAARLLPMPLRRWLFRDVHKPMGGKLRYVMSGGAYLDPQLARKWAALGIPILQGYGATEASPVITTNSFQHNRLGSVGRVIPGQEVKIADDGEVLTRGDNVTQGYWRNPDATKAAFEDGWYKTGDLGYLDKDGFLYLKGRKKDLIVLSNGQNVYPEDIESLLNKQPGVKDSVVVGLPPSASSGQALDSGGVRVHAVLLLEEEATPSAAREAVSAVNRVVSDHQRIRGHTVWPQEDFPRTHTMKVRKPLVLDFLQKRQREPDDDPEDESDPPRPPKNSPPNELYALVALQCSRPATQLKPELRLEADLSLDSLGRVELLSSLEDELGVYIDEQQVGPETTLADLEALLGAGAVVQRMSFPKWGREPWCRVLRVFLQWAAVFPALRLFYRVRILGREHLKAVKGPVLFAANHNVKMDNPMIIMALPFIWRWRLTIAAAADDVFGNRVWKVAAPLLGNAFPFSREGAIRPSLEHLGYLMDEGWSVLIYPEGRNNRGEMDSFKPGAGMVAVESSCSIVPLRVRLLKGSVFDRSSLFSRGRVEIKFGPALRFPRRIDYRDATQQLESAVRAL